MKINLAQNEKIGISIETSYHIETSPLICRANLYDFYMIDLRFERVKNGYLKKEHRVIYRSLPNIIIEQFCQNSSRLFIFHYFRKKLYLIRMTRNKMHIWKKNLTKYLIRMNTKINNFLNFMDPFYEWGSTASRLQPLRGGSLLFTIQFSEIPGAHFIDLGRMKG